MKYTFYYVDSNDCDIKTSHYEFDSIEEARSHATKLLANDMMNTDHIEISSEEVTRLVVRYGEE